jgi:hypothetical protein
MELQTSPNITSFVIRFVQSESPPLAEATDQRRLSYRGTIRHIQSDEEISFIRWADAIEFIRRFVQLEIEEG